MTTKHSPLHALRKQADHIAAMLKAAERGEKLDIPFADKVAAARKGDTVKVAVAMDDKILSIEMRWDVIRATSEAGLSEYIVKQMRERTDTLQ